MDLLLFIKEIPTFQKNVFTPILSYIKIPPYTMYIAWEVIKFGIPDVTQI